MYHRVDNHMILSSMTEKSARLLFPLFREDIAELVRWFGFDVSFSMESEMQYLAERVLPYDDAIIVHWDGIPCGRIGIYDFDEDNHSIFLYYWVSSRYRRIGIARNSIRAALDFLRSIGIQEVLFDVDRDNLPSVNLLESLPGVFVKDGDHEKYVIYAVKLV